MKARLNRILLAGALVLLLVGATAGWLLHGESIIQPDRFSHRAFAEWQTANPDSHREFAVFSRFLAEQGVANTVPAWQLTRTDVKPHRNCRRPAFLIPPREDWPNIVPVLRLVRDQIVPVVGQVEVVSSYRTLDFNACVGGASKSRHLGFSAIDLIVPGQGDSRALFTKLCAIHAQIGPRTNFGLGAYFDPDALKPNTVGRFHVDVSGFRSWGYSKHAASSGCRFLVTNPAPAPSNPAAAPSPKSV